MAESENVYYGLSSAEVEARHEQGLDNRDVGVKTKSVKQIILNNIFTFFNIVNFILAFLVLSTGSIKNVLFLGVVVANTAIGSFQEIRSKKTIDKLSLISAPKVNVIRDGNLQTITVSEVVKDDLIMLEIGNQVCADCVVVSGEAEVDESLLTGESDPVGKKPGDRLMSGSFIVSGNCLAYAEKVGAESYANKIAGEASKTKDQKSEIMKSLNVIVKFISFSLVPVGGLLFWKSFFVEGVSYRNSIVSMVAALTGMIPEGLVLLTSVVFAVSVIRLSKHNTLVQELYCIEALARVDVLCLDKTGTITEGSMQFDGFVPLDGHDEDEMKAAVSSLVTVLNDNNPTYNALLTEFGKESSLTAKNTVPFSSARKWSGAEFESGKTYLMGAGEFILGGEFSRYKDIAESYAASGSRVLLLASSDNGFDDKGVPENTKAVGLILISDKIRAEAPDTLAYFAEQGVDLKVISGDNAVTVSQIAKKAGLKNAENYIDASTLTTDEEIKEAVLTHSVFGRVTPEQKYKFVRFLKDEGHTVAMTGDGVNDVLALRESDCSIAMASGSDAARTVSDLVLLDSNFASLPKVVREGRRSINNLQRSASLFLTKTIFSVLLSVLFIFVSTTYPFEPIQMSLISSLTIGIPSFILALEPNKDRIKGRFIVNVIKKAIPSAVPMFLNILMLVLIERAFSLSFAELSATAVILTFFTGVVMLFRVSFPFNFMRFFLFIFVITAFVIAYVYFSTLLSLTPPNYKMCVVILPYMLMSLSCTMAISHFIENVIERKEEKK